MISEHVCQRPIKVGIFGAKGSGKSSIALQYLTEYHTDPGPTTIEDIYRKDVTISINDRETVEVFYFKWRNERHSQTEKRRKSDSSNGRRSCSSLTPDCAKLKFSLEITDTAGFVAPSCDKPVRASLVEKFTRRRQSFPKSPRVKNNRNARSHSTGSLGVLSSLARHETCLNQCDALILVFSLLDPPSLKVVREIRNRFVKIKVGQKNSGKRSRLPACFRGNTACNTGKVPPVFVVGTHSDERNARMPNERTSRLYDVNCSRDKTMLNARRREKLKESMEQHNSTSPLVFPHQVYDVINDWPECAGFAEISLNDRPMVRQVFEELALACVTSLPLSVWTAT